MSFAEISMEQKVLAIGLILIAARFSLKLILKKTYKESIKKFFVEILDWVNTALGALMIAFLVMYFVFQAFKIPSESMLNTMRIGDHLFVNKFVFGTRLPVLSTNQTGSGVKIGNKYFNVKMKRFFVKKEPKRGEMIVFAFPEDTSKDFIKRCIGLSGDKIEIVDKVLYVNDVKQDEPYVIHTDDRIFKKEAFVPSNFIKRDNFGPVIVPKDTYFVMGDNRDNSYDSRFWGFLDKNYLKGKPAMVFWPLKRIRFV